MNGKRHGKRALAAVLALSIGTAAAVSAAVMTLPAEMEAGGVVLLDAGRLGIADWEGNFSILSEDSGGGYFRFWEEPLILRIDPEGPAAGKVLPGDRIVSAGGHLITTEKGSRLFSAPDPGEEVELLLRRRGEMITERIVAVRWDPEPFRSPPALPLPPSEMALPAPSVDVDFLPAPVLPVLPPPGRGLLPHTWLGMGLRCSLEGSLGEEDLRFVEPPEVFDVRRETAADRAGFRKGDEILAVNGKAIDTREGTASFTAIQPGDRVEWTVERDGEEVVLAMVAEPLPTPAGSIPRSISDGVVYVGKVDGVSVEVRGSSRIIVEEKEDGSGILIRTGEGTIRVRSDDESEE